jgi:predicted DNA-binding transcriptional regulator AlpA
MKGSVEVESWAASIPISLIPMVLSFLSARLLSAADSDKSRAQAPPTETLAPTPGLNRVIASAATPEPQECRLLRLAKVIGMTGLSRTTIWRLERTGEFPRRRKINRSVAWLESEVKHWIETAGTGQLQF